MSKVLRVYVEKKPSFRVEAHELLTNIKTQLNINLNYLSVVNRYDLAGLKAENLNEAVNIVLSEPMVDDYYLEDYPLNGKKVFAIEYLPGQYDQRADACEQCLKILANEDVKVKCARVYIVDESLTEEQIETIKKYLINPVDQRLASLEKYESLEDEEVVISEVKVIEDFINYTKEQLENYLKENGMAMNYDDLKVAQDYFLSENRNPTETELKVLDTYWSDHCRHTTFSTILSDVKIDDGEFKEVLEADLAKYITSRPLVYGIETKRPLTLMD